MITGDADNVTHTLYLLLHCEPRLLQCWHYSLMASNCYSINKVKMNFKGYSNNNSDETMYICRISTQELSIDETSWLGSLASVGALIGTMVSWIVTRYLSARQVYRWGLGYLWHSAAGSVHLQCWHCHRLDSDFLCSSSVWQQTRQTIINSICRPVACFWSILDSWCWASHVVFPTHCHLFTSQKLLDCPTKE